MNVFFPLTDSATGATIWFNVNNVVAYSLTTNATAITTVDGISHTVKENPQAIQYLVSSLK